MDMAPIGLLVVVLVGGAVALAGLVGLVLLIIGLAKKRTALWVCGLVAMALAGLVVLLAVPMALWLTVRAAPHERVVLAPAVAEAGASGGGNYVRSSSGRAEARVQGIYIQVLQPGPGGNVFRTHTTSSGPLRRPETRHDITMGDVQIVVENRDGRITLSVNGQDVGPVQPGDRIVVTEGRDVVVNGQRRLP